MLTETEEAIIFDDLLREYDGVDQTMYEIVKQAYNKFRHQAIWERTPCSKTTH